MYVRYLLYDVGDIAFSCKRGGGGGDFNTESSRRLITVLKHITLTE